MGSQSTLELGHHQAAGPGEVDLLLSLRDPRCVQPLRHWLDGGDAQAPKATNGANRGLDQQTAQLK